MDGLQGAKHHAVTHPHQAPAPHRLDDLRIEELWHRHPARLRRRPFVLAAWRLRPVPIVGQQGRHVLAKAIREKEWRAVGAKSCATWWTARWAIASVRSPTSITSSSLL